MKKIQNHPEILHGILAGFLLLVAKLILLSSGNWFFRVDTTYNFLAFVVILAATIMAGKAEKRKRKKFPYFRAWASAVFTISIAVFISFLGDQIAYRTKPKLADDVKQFNLEQLHARLPKMTFLGGEMQEKIITEMEESDPKDIYSIGAFITNLFTFVFLNSLWAFIVAAFTRKTTYSELDTLDI